MENRLSRGGYWLRWLITFVISLAVAFLAQLTGGVVAAVIELIISLAVSIYMIVAGVRRMHDVDKSGWFILVPIYNLILTLTDGTPGPNRFGDDPRGRGRGTEEASGTWDCPACGARNTSFDKEKCFKCGSPRPAEAPPTP
jgi:uncharacterized membrane protein YhaH (DUF805 family)